MPRDLQMLSGRQDGTFTVSQQSKGKSEPLDLIHTLNTPTLPGCHYFVTMIEDFSRYSVVYFITKKLKVTWRIREYVRLVQTIFGRTQLIRLAQGGEYPNETLDRFCREEGFSQQFTTAYTAQQIVQEALTREGGSLYDCGRSIVVQILG